MDRVWGAVGGTGLVRSDHTVAVDSRVTLVPMGGVDSLMDSTGKVLSANQRGIISVIRGPMVVAEHWPQALRDFPC